MPEKINIFKVQSFLNILKYEMKIFHFYLNIEVYYRTDPLVRKEDSSVSNVKLQETCRGDLLPVDYCYFLLKRIYSNTVEPN
jgi:hypothetical protein